MICVNESGFYIFYEPLVNEEVMMFLCKNVSDFLYLLFSFEETFLGLFL